MRGFTRKLILGAMAAAAAACGDPSRVVDPARPAADMSAAAAGGFVRPVFHSNAVKYRDSGAQPATGRSGSASLTARALLGRDGITTLDLTTGTLDVSGAPGTLAKTQVKALDASGTVAWTKNFTGDGGAASYAFPGRLRNSLVQAQSNVRSIDGTRTDVVTVATEVKLRPDLRGDSALYVPPRVTVNLPVSMWMPISEINGDVGARADCVLYVDGSRADVAVGIWVDAGSGADCMFTWTFTELGTHRVQARIENVVPGDYDDSNNASPVTTVEVTRPALFYQAQVGDGHSESSTDFTDAWHSLDGMRNSESAASWSYVQDYQYGSFYAYGDAPLEFPLGSVSLSQSTGGQVLDAVEATDVVPTYSWGDAQNGGSCLDAMTPSGAFVSICGSRSTDGAAGTVWSSSISYARNGGVVTYVSHGTLHLWGYVGDGTPYDDVYINAYYNQSQFGTPLVPFGDDYTFTVHVVTSRGELVANPIVTLTPYSESGEQPLTCYDYSYADVVGRQCFSSGYSGHGRFGQVTGVLEPR